MANIMQMMKQAKEMQTKMAEMQAKLADLEVNGEAGAGMLKVTINGRGEMRNISIDPKLVDANDLEMLEFKERSVFAELLADNQLKGAFRAFELIALVLHLLDHVDDLSGFLRILLDLGIESLDFF